MKVGDTVRLKNCKEEWKVSDVGKAVINGDVHSVIKVSSIGEYWYEESDFVLCHDWVQDMFLQPTYEWKISGDYLIRRLKS